MDFKYKNVSKSLLCMLMPVLSGCGAHKNAAQPQDNRDAVQVLYNQASSAAQYYDNIFDIIAKDYCESDSLGNKAMARYQLNKLNWVVDSMVYYQDVAEILARQLPSSGAAHGMDSVRFQYDRALVAGQCYLDTRDMLMADYENAQNRGLATYQVRKMIQLADSLAHYRSLQRRMLREYPELQRTK